MWRSVPWELALTRRGPAPDGGSLGAGFGQTWRTMPDRLTTNGRAPSSSVSGRNRDFTWVNTPAL
jgi:hypothetical protein